MPRLGSPREEMDKTYTPLEKRRREEMRLKPVRYGFFRVATEPTEFPKCVKCRTKLFGPHTVINGKHYCQACF
jgi:hypothetical protein